MVQQLGLDPHKPAECGGYNGWDQLPDTGKVVSDPLAIAGQVTNTDSSESHVDNASSLDAKHESPEGSGPVVCPKCGISFTRYHNLKAHMSTHSSERPFACEVCNSKFRRMHDLNRHRKLHTGERPFVCSKCGRKFARMDALARHTKGPHGCAQGKLEPDAVDQMDANGVVGLSKSVTPTSDSSIACADQLAGTGDIKHEGGSLGYSLKGVKDIVGSEPSSDVSSVSSFITDGQSEKTKQEENKFQVIRPIKRSCNDKRYNDTDAKSQGSVMNTSGSSSCFEREGQNQWPSAIQNNNLMDPYNHQSGHNSVTGNEVQEDNENSNDYVTKLEARFSALEQRLKAAECRIAQLESQPH